MEEQHYVEEIIGGDPNVEEHHQVDHTQLVEGMDTQQIHVDEDGNAHIVTQGQMHDLVTFHAVGVDAQGNYVTDGTEEGEVGVDGEMGDHVGCLIYQ
jgi:hypothetical protein